MSALYSAEDRQRDEQSVRDALAAQQQAYREEQRPALENITRCQRERVESANVGRMAPSEASRVILREWNDAFGPQPPSGLPTDFSDQYRSESRRYSRRRGTIMVCRGSGIQHYKGVG
jgi:hypothetical protein